MQIINLFGPKGGILEDISFDRRIKSSDGLKRKMFPFSSFFRREYLIMITILYQIS